MINPAVKNITKLVKCQVLYVICQWEECIRKKITSLKGIYSKVGLGSFEGECYSDTNQPLSIFFAIFVPVYFCFSVGCLSLITQYLK